MIESVLKGFRNLLIVLLHRQVHRLADSLDRIGGATSLVIRLSQFGETTASLSSSDASGRRDRGIGLIFSGLKWIAGPNRLDGLSTKITSNQTGREYSFLR